MQRSTLGHIKFNEQTALAFVGSVKVVLITTRDAVILGFIK